MKAVIRDCCTSGNCDKCHGVTPFRVCMQVCQTMPEGVSEAKAAMIADNWREYDAQVVSVEHGVLVAKVAADLTAKRRAELDLQLSKRKRAV